MNKYIALVESFGNMNPIPNSFQTEEQAYVAIQEYLGPQARMISDSSYDLMGEEVSVRVMEI